MIQIYNAVTEGSFIIEHISLIPTSLTTLFLHLLYGISRVTHLELLHQDKSIPLVQVVNRNEYRKEINKLNSLYVN